MQQVPLNSGTSIPIFGWGIGTAWFNPSEEKVKLLQQSLQQALDAGFRHIDSAQMYQDEHHAGPALQEWLKKSGVSRSDLFITSKVKNDHKEPQKLREALRQTLADLQLDYVDLYLIHSPFESDVPVADTWREMEKVKEEGLVKAIGVSNFQVEHLREILDVATVPPALNEIEYSVYLQQPELLAFCKENNIVVSSYSGLGPMLKYKGGPVDAVVDELTKKHSATPMQILQSWIRAKDVVVITTTSKKERMDEVLAGLRLQLDDEDINKLDEAGKPYAFRQYWARYLNTTPAPWLDE